MSGSTLRPSVREGRGAIDADPARDRHRLYEDVLALLTGTLLVALGLSFYTEAMLGTGGVAGLALLGQYATGIGFGPLFFLFNLPFYLLAVVRLGWGYTLRTVAAVALVSLFARQTSEWIDVAALDPLYATIAGGILIGMGLLVLFRHRSGLGGFNILATFLQDRHGIRAGLVQLALDAAVLLAALFVLPLDRVALSLIGALVLNMILAINHRPGRYVGVS